jgi:hypothetical protein
MTEECIADEVTHLAVAMQFCGFRSVVGTMWAMADIDPFMSSFSQTKPKAGTSMNERLTQRHFEMRSRN